ncbi:phosphotransferase family protein [Zooshikella sp. RANM57]|uniref:phosphotransferase family protein n=1 Tax=Zooshikella sp. RANM57 TaxID=3425863 RepID=UPI003D6E0EB9
MGSAEVYITEYLGVLCVHKVNVSPVEMSFYKQVAPQLEMQGINIPRLIDTNGNDLFLEYIPNQLSLSELNKAPETYKQLVLIHNCSLPFIPDRKLHCWTSEQTQNTLSVLDLPKFAEDLLNHLCKLSSVLFQSNSFISGDTNAGNWGKRNNGEFVLFDWERFVQGSPAIDLAPLVQGMGNKATYTDVVERYIKHNSITDGAELYRQLILAKAWIVVEVVNLLVIRNNAMTDKFINWYNDILPDWCEMILTLL